MNTTGACGRNSILNHPCFYGSAKARWGRIHLPVAPGCNIQCGFCNRQYDCANESRPAVTKMILDPSQVIGYLHRIFQMRQDISVVGIAGPGDPLCDPERTLDTLKAVHATYPQLLVCLSSNGLNLVDHVDDLVGVGVTHATVTINAVDPVIGGQIYEWVKINQHVYRGREASSILYARQKEAILRLKARNVAVKINTVVIPGINDNHVEAIARAVVSLGADVMNCIPMIPLPDTPLGHLSESSGEEMIRLREIAERYIPQMYHCQRCRSDAAGLLPEENPPARSCAQIR